MKFGLFISLILHGGILAWALMSIQATKPVIVPKPKPIVVDITTIDKLTQAKKGATKKKPKKKIALKKPPVKARPKKKVKPAPQKTAALPPRRTEPPKPDPIKDFLKKPPPKKLKPARKPAPKKTVTKKKPKPKPRKVVKKTRKKITAKTKKNFDTESIAALLNKIPDARPGPKPKKVVRKKAKRVPVKADQGDRDGAARKLTISEFDFFIRQIGNCFAIPAGARDAEDFRPVVAFSLRKDGSVKGVPRVVNKVNSPFFRIAAESSVRAILECQPYAMPKNKYNDWKKNKITFDLKAMIGG